MMLLTAIFEVQIPVVAALLLAGCSAKLIRIVRTGSADAGLGPAMLVPVRLRLPVAVSVSVTEGALGVGLVVTAGRFGAGVPALCIRLGAGLLLLIATTALIELRAARPDAGCGCFGDFSTTPVSGRTLARSGLLAVAALSTIWLHQVRQPSSVGAALQLLIILGVELLVVGALSPEIAAALVRLGCSQPCELREVPVGRTLTALRRSKQWRRYAGPIVTTVPADVWRELCWRYVVFQAEYDGRPAEVVFAVFMQQMRPAIRAALVDTASGSPVPFPAVGPGQTEVRSLGETQQEGPVPDWAAKPGSQVAMPFSRRL
jgi:hypothetical protein